MKRRKFLSLIGAATTVPLMPSVSLGSAPVSAAFKGAVAHAKASPYVSTWGLMHKLGVPVEEASALMTELSQKGILAPVKGLRGSSRWAHSQAYVPPAFPGRRVRPQKAKPQPQAEPRRLRQTPKIEPQTDLLMAHLRQIATDYFAAKHA